MEFTETQKNIIFGSRITGPEKERQSSVLLPSKVNGFQNASYVFTTSSAAQGGGGSFKIGKATGKVGCFESRMAERIH